MKTLKVGLVAGAIAALTVTTALAEGGVIRFGHDNKTDPFENPAHACTAVFSNIVAADTNGSVTVEVFGSNQLGSAAEHVQQVRDGVIQATLTSTGALASYYPRIDVLNLPLRLPTMPRPTLSSTAPSVKRLQQTLKKPLVTSWCSASRTRVVSLP